MIQLNKILDNLLDAKISKAEAVYQIEELFKKSEFSDLTKKQITTTWKKQIFPTY